MSGSAVDRLGVRLRDGSTTEADLRRLEEYRRSFYRAYESVIQAIRESAGSSPTGRPAKSTRSIVEKLRRESIRLSQVQDIAGCRLVVSDLDEQDMFASKLAEAFPGASVTDRRQRPSHGYRALHMIARMFNKPIEIQIRTSLQHSWAEFSEKCSDTVDPAVKYGGGPEVVRDILEKSSNNVATSEAIDREVAATYALIQQVEAGTNTLRSHRHQLQTMKLSLGAGTTESTQRRIAEIEESIQTQLNESAASLEGFERSCRIWREQIEALRARRELSRNGLVSSMLEAMNVITAEFGRGAS